MNTTQDISPKERAKWQVPAMETPLWLGKQHPYCVVIPVINEGERIKSLLKRMEAERISSIADIIIVDGGSTDGSLELDSLQQVGVRGLVVKKGPGKLSGEGICECDREVRPAVCDVAHTLQVEAGDKGRFGRLSRCAIAPAIGQARVRRQQRFTVAAGRQQQGQSEGDKWAHGRIRKVRPPSMPQQRKPLYRAT